MKFSTIATVLVARKSIPVCTKGEKMKPTMEQLQQRLADAKDYRLTTEGRADVAEQRMVAAREAVRKIEEQIDALKPV